MTTTVTIRNNATSNGDVHVRAISTWMPGANKLAPGESAEYGITESSIMTVIESMPATRGADIEVLALQAGEQADKFVAEEVARQDKMWGIANDRADASAGQLLDAGRAQLEALSWRRSGNVVAFDAPPASYPTDWSGFRDYGSDVANLAVAAAYIRQEIKRLIASGADTTRTKRNVEIQPYIGDQPNVQL